MDSAFSTTTSTVEDEYVSDASSPTVSHQSSDSEPDAYDHGSCDTALTEFDVEASSDAVELSPDSKVAPSATPTPPASKSVATPAVVKEGQRLPISEIFKPKIKLLKMLLQIDFFAGCVIIITTVLSGGLNSLKTATQTRLAASMMQILLTKTISTRETTKLLLQHLLFEVVIHGLQAFTTYAFRRTRLPLRKALHVDLMNAFTSLPYDMMMDKQIMHQFRKAASEVASDPVRILRQSMPMIVFIVESICNLIALINLSISIPSVRPTLLFLAPCYFGFSMIKLYRQWSESKTRKNYETRYLHKTRSHRRAFDIQYLFYYTGDAVKRDLHLLNTKKWIQEQFSDAMDDLIQRPRSFLSKRKGQLADKGIATAYDLFAKFSLPIAVVFYGLELSLTNHAVLAERLGALSQCLMNLGRQVIVQDNGDQIVSTYYKCIQLGVEPTGKQKTLVDARIEDLTVDGSESWEIEFRGVSFAYPQTQSADTTEIKSNEKQSPPDFVLEDFNFKFERGKTYGIVGHNGRGKTTLVQLLAGLYTPTKGQIFINGIDMQRFNISDLRTKMSILFQDFAKYHDLSVLENIFMGNITNDITLATQRAAETGVNFVPLDSVLYNLSKRPKHPDETWQTQLSGGQWQKIALARAFMRIDAELLVLDEPTSALDIESEHKLFKMILAKRHGKTTIFVTHKLNTTRIADCVLFIKDGKVCEAGSHDELIALNGEYARLWRIQSTGYDELVESME